MSLDVLYVIHLMIVIPMRLHLQCETSINLLREINAVQRTLSLLLAKKLFILWYAQCSDLSIYR